MLKMLIVMLLLNHHNHSFLNSRFAYCVNGKVNNALDHNVCVYYYCEYCVYRSSIICYLDKKYIMQKSLMCLFFIINNVSIEVQLFANWMKNK